MSGTTGVCLLFRGGDLYIGNVGDSRAICGIKTEDGHLEAVSLSYDQSPYRKDEYERLENAGAEILTFSQKKGELSKSIKPWDLGDANPGDRPRVWTKDKSEIGCEYTRSIGDSAAEKIGVVAVPEIAQRCINEDYQYFVIACDGVFEFLTNDDVIKILESSKSLIESCQRIVGDSRNHWLICDKRCDDITCIVIKISKFKLYGNKIDVKLNQRSRIGSQVNISQKPVRNKKYIYDKNDINRTNIPITDEEKSYTLPTEYHGLIEDRPNIYKAIKSQILFKDLDDEIINGLVNVTVVIKCEKNEVLTKRKGSRDYMIAFKGKYTSIIKFKDSEDVKFEYVAYNGFFPCFGELELLYNMPYKTEIVCNEDGILFVINKLPFRSVVLKYVYNKNKYLINSLMTLSNLNANDIQDISDNSIEKDYICGDIILDNKNDNDNLYYILEGIVSIKCYDKLTGKNEEEKYIFYI